MIMDFLFKIYSKDVFKIDHKHHQNSKLNNHNAINCLC